MSMNEELREEKMKSEAVGLRELLPTVLEAMIIVAISAKKEIATDTTNYGGREHVIS